MGKYRYLFFETKPTIKENVIRILDLLKSEEEEENILALRIFYYQIPNSDFVLKAQIRRSVLWSDPKYRSNDSGLWNFLLSLVRQKCERILTSSVYSNVA